ncbi:hypothetical protein GGF31_001469 [Allomyces arbusculus]|nr:hypothetical protein GGF31_001469 [Allomyces arbusculus]
MSLAGTPFSGSLGISDSLGKDNDSTGSVCANLGGVAHPAGWLSEINRALEQLDAVLDETHEMQQNVAHASTDNIEALGRDLNALKRKLENIKNLPIFSTFARTSSTASSTTKKKLDLVEKRLLSVEIRQESLEKKVDLAEKKVDLVEQRLKLVEKKVDSVEKKVDSVEKKVDSVEQRLKLVETQVNGLKTWIDVLRDQVEGEMREARAFRSEMRQYFRSRND